MTKSTFQVLTENNLEVNGDVYYDSPTDAQVLIVSHGFKAYRNWGFFPYMCEQFAKNNLIVVNIDFSLNGIVDEEKGLFDVEKFRKVTVSQEILDLNTVISEIPEILGEELKSNWNGKVSLLGHSLGGAVSIITAANRDDINSVITWGSIGDIDRNTDRQKEEWRKKGIMEFENRITKQNLILNVNYLEDKLVNKEAYDLEKNAAKLNIPLLVLHGSSDFTVRLHEAKMLHNAAQNSQLAIIDRANHTFNARHPFTGANKYLDEAISETIKFLGVN